jgi:hypothetical protein
MSSSLPRLRMASRRFNASRLIASLDALALNPVDTVPPPSRTTLHQRPTSTAQPPATTIRRPATTITLPTLRSYSYKEYPKTCVVYTTHEEEANELIGSLKPGYAFRPSQNRLLNDRQGCCYGPRVDREFFSNRRTTRAQSLSNTNRGQHRRHSPHTDK